MKRVAFIIIIVHLLSLSCFGQKEEPIRKELEILKPFIGKIWDREIPTADGKNSLHFLCKFESMYNGNILKYSSECKEVNFRVEGYFYYDPDKKEIAFFTLANNGNINVGNVRSENNMIVENGNTILAERKLQFRVTFEVISNGDIIDKSYRLDNGEWKAGPSTTWKAK